MDRLEIGISTRNYSYLVTDIKTEVTYLFSTLAYRQKYRRVIIRMHIQFFKVENNIEKRIDTVLEFE